MSCGEGSKIMASLLIHSLWQMELSKGCVLASILFSMMFSAMLINAFKDGDNGIPIKYHFNGKLFNLRRLQAKSKVQKEVLDEFHFAVDMAKGAPTEEKMQKKCGSSRDSCDSNCYDLTISIKKTEVVYQPASGKSYKEPTIIVEGQRLQVVDKFTYLGSTFSGVIHIDHEVNARIAKASAAFCRLRGSIWDRNQTRLYCTDLYCSQHYYTQVKLGQFTSGMPKDWTTSIQDVLENL